MNYQDREKLKRLTETFDRNYRVTNLYATYLERFPELINSEMISEILSDGKIELKDAIVALLSEAFLLRNDNPEDKRIIREYLYPSVTILDKKKYTENPYYKNINIQNICGGRWEFKKESYPPYRAMICGDMRLFSDFSELPPLGFFAEQFDFPAVLEDGNEWMTLSPVDIDTCEEVIEAAHGDVITFGLGLGYYAYMVSEKSDVNSITVIEKSPEVIDLFKTHILPQFKNAQKVKIICSDAFEYAEKIMPSENYTLAFVDTWRDASDGAPMYKKMKELEKLSPNTTFMYWVEGFLVSRLRALKFENMLSLVENESPDAPKDFEDFKKSIQEVI